MKGINREAYLIEPACEECSCRLELIHTAFDQPPVFGIVHCEFHQRAQQMGALIMAADNLVAVLSKCSFESKTGRAVGEALAAYNDARGI